MAKPLPTAVLRPSSPPLARPQPAADVAQASTLRALLFPASPGWPADPWRPEVVAAEQAGFVTYRVDLVAALAGAVGTTVARVPHGGGPVLFRGPVLSAEAWRTLETALRTRGWHLVPSAAQRDACHLVPLVEAALQPVATTGAVWTDGFDADAAWARFGALRSGAIVHDHASPCTQPLEAMMWVPKGATRAVFDAAVAEVLEQRGDDAVGGFVLRRPVALEAAQAQGEAPTERVGRAVCWQGVDLLDSGVADLPGLPDLRELTLRLGNPFLCLDVALDPDGRGVLVGVDDASAAELPEGTDLVAFYAALRAAVG